MMDAYEVGLEVERLLLVHQQRRPLYSDPMSTGPGVSLSVPASTEVEFSELEEAASELARQTGLSYKDVWASAHALSTGRSTRELTFGLAAVAQELLPLTHGDDGSATGETIGLSSAAEAASYPSRRLVQTGTGYGTVALSADDDDELSEYLPDDDELPEVTRLSAEYSEYFGLAARKGKTHTYAEPDSMDHAQPRKGGDVHSEVQRYLAMAEHEFGGEALHAGRHGSDSYRPKSRAQRDREQSRARPGHTNGEGWSEGGRIGSGSPRPRRGTLVPS